MEEAPSGWWRKMKTKEESHVLWSGQFDDDVNLEGESLEEVQEVAQDSFDYSPFSLLSSSLLVPELLLEESYS